MISSTYKSRKFEIKEKYELLTPIKHLHNDNNGKAIFEFKCDCGKSKITRISDVKSGRIKSCGCMHKLNGVMCGFLRTIYLEEKQFKEFNVIKRNTKRSTRYGAYYICKCDCGETFERLGSRIITGKTKRCKKCQLIYNGKYRERKEKND